jgi:hypothetical protein
MILEILIQLGMNRRSLVLLLLTFLFVGKSFSQKIYSVSYDYQADLKIYFIEYDYQAKWRNTEKKHLLY